MTLPQDLAHEVTAWIADDVDPAAAAELQQLLDAGDAAELADRFSGPLAFGTAGLRGPLRAGPNGMNRTVVRRAAAGLAAWLTARGEAGRPVVVGYDARHGSRDFAHDSAAVFAAAGLEARILPRVLPTPVLAFAVRRLDAAAGVMVTASHNPPQDNGYKVYAADAGQIVPPVDREIEAAIRAVGRTRDIPLDTVRPVLLDESIVTSYVAAVAGLVPDGPRELRIVHTALHGVGTETVRAVFGAAGFTDLTAVPEQERPDPDFPTVAFPNPEEPGALDLALALARERGADIVLANDPDADRCAVAVPGPDGWRMLRGDEVGVLLADAMLRDGVQGTYATTIVSSALLGALARRHGAGYAETLTGFKWIVRAAPDLVFGYEEALGYAVAPELVRDKDGISAALRVAALAAVLRRDGSSLLGRLDELAAEYGRYATDQVSLRVDDLTLIAETMARLRADPPTTLLGAAPAVEDLLPATDGLRWHTDVARVVVRPSGTEPKLKAYLEVIDAGGSADAANAALARLRAEVSDVLGV
ncbi:phospho-sugar mutase [uncultured Jatrophihabitans sp.]|uniref:phospho-sugar mutase n=1 Tax=uncultured Jatrophihabitans sp. TaxID=1610747 RepID=UPI0035C98ACC